MGEGIIKILDTDSVICYSNSIITDSVGIQNNNGIKYFISQQPKGGKIWLEISLTQR